MRRFPTTALILVAAAVTLIGGWLLYARGEETRFNAVSLVRDQRSEIRLTYTVEHDGGPIARETWYLENLNGHSTASYAAFDRKGTVAKFVEPIVGYDVTFLFDKLVQDGIWKLPTRPFVGNNSAVHTVKIAQVAGPESGSHEFRFSDAKYIAVEAGRQYEIKLDKNKPVPNLLMLQSTSTADPRYLQIERDFEDFGTPTFRRTVVAAREKLLKS